MKKAVLLELFVSHKMVIAEELRSFDLVELVVAGHDGHNGLTFAIDERERFAGAVLRKPKNSATASMVPKPGVCTRSSSPVPGPSDTATVVDAASSSAAKPQSPDKRGLAGIGKRHVLDKRESPPISPESAATVAP